ncbi:MAG: hypothetical protein AAF602_08270 [Myxococcota bacterium]
MKSATRRLRAFPYRFGGRGGALEVTAVRCDGVLLDAEIGADTIEIDQPSATSIELRLRYLVPILDDLVAADEVEGPPIRVAFVAEEPASWLRWASRATLDGNEARGSLQLEPRDVAEAVTIRAVVVRDTRREPGGGVAWERGARLVESTPLLVRLRERRVAVGSFMSVRWHSFESEPSLSGWSGLPWYLQLQADPPVLWLNTDLTDVAQVLTSRGHRGRTARLRETLYRSIAMTVWTQLFEDAVRSLAWDDDDGALYGRDWHEHVLRHVAQHAVADRPRAERLDVLLERARTAVDGAGRSDRSLLSEEASRGIARWLDLGQVIERASREIP